ncbi:MAG: isoleucine--tRNA ligase [Kiritimatiellaeota bacterium]|nr:isoleucine--tRNA ligase [Kiritimatiellota bacterium]
MLKPVSNKIDFPGLEREILRFWKEQQTFRQSLELRRDAPEFVFYDGPPFATGLPHYGHLLASMIKDIVPRYQTMRGNYVERRFGWDCHGLPVEYEMEQELQISGKRQIEELGVGVFNEKCRGIVLRYAREWRELVTRMGRWVDFDHDYKTMDLPFMESIWWVFQSLWKKDLIYEGNKILPYCPRCATPLSNFETNQGNAEVQDPAITIRFAVDGQPHTCILAWTTTPWTLPSNLALAVGADIMYLKVRDGDHIHILAKDRFPAYYPQPERVQILEELPGAALVGWRYAPLFPYFAAYKAAHGAFRVTAADFVTTADGTGVVHIAPGFGEDDCRLGQAKGLPALCPVDDEGCFTSAVGDYAGRPVKETDKDIIHRLKTEGRLFHQGTIQHSYPHCWRCDAPLIYRAVSTWFLRVEQLKDRLLAANAQTRWMPEHLRDGRFGNWLEGARDWAISRNRYWGTPLPIWRTADGRETVCVGSLAELEKLSGRKLTDLHKHLVDPLTWIAPGGGEMRRVPQVLDCWFESGAMPYAQQHYPFENKARFEGHFPADFIAEGLDQTRGWFYTLLVLSTALFDRPAFKNVIVNGLVLAADGRKMSKRLKNYPDPAHLLDTHGADALRLYLIHSPVVRAEDLRFSEDGVKQCLRDFLIPLWNAYSFFVTYARVDGWQSEDSAQRSAINSRPEIYENQKSDIINNKFLLDRWVLSALERLTQEVTTAMDAYDLQQAVRPFVRFIEDLTNWYIRRSRRRFWKSSDDADKAHAYATLYEVLLTLSKIAAPFVPFISEAIYRNLRTPNLPESVHLCDFPQADVRRRDPALEAQMEAVMTVVQLGRAIRAERNLKVRQPLVAAHVVCRHAGRLDQIRALQELIVDELNVKAVVFNHDETELVNLTAKPDFKKLGPRLGSRVKQAAGLIQQWPSAKLNALLHGENVTLELDGQTFEIAGDDLAVQRQPKHGLAVASAGDLVVALEVDLTEALIREGLARELVNRIQSLRKDADLEVTRRIRVQFAGDEQLRAAVREHQEFIQAETLCTELQWSDTVAGEACDLNGHPARLQLQPL